MLRCVEGVFRRFFILPTDIIICNIIMEVKIWSVVTIEMDV